jgi:hypothetical protein
MSKYSKYLIAGMVFNGWEVIKPDVESNEGKPSCRWSYRCKCTDCGLEKGIDKNRLASLSIGLCDHKGQKQHPKYLEKGTTFSGWEVVEPEESKNIRVKPSEWFYKCVCPVCENEKLVKRTTLLIGGINPCSHDVVRNKKGRTCTMCDQFLSWDSFGEKEDGFNRKNHWCIGCTRKKSTLYYHSVEKLDMQNNPEKYREINKAKYQKDKENIQKKHSEYYFRTKESRREHKRNYRKNRLENDSAFKLESTLRNSISRALKASTSKKFLCSNKMLGCTPKECVDYLNDNEFGYNFKDHGMFSLHVDHIIPCAFFNLDNALEQLICFNYNNLRLYPAKENWAKHAHIEDMCQDLYLEIQNDVLKKYPELEEGI